MREIRCAIELRADESRVSPGRVVGTLIEYETRAQDRAETFAVGALHWPDGGIILNIQHDRAQPIFRFVPELRGKEVVIDAPLPDTSKGRDVATMIRNGTFRGLSVEFRAEDEGHRAGMREVRRARLLAAGLVDDSSYGTTVEVRHRGPAGRMRRWQ